MRKFGVSNRTKFTAVRIEAEVDAPWAIDPLAFVNTGGGYVVVVKAAAASQFTIRDLPPGRYGICYTTDKEYNKALPPVTLSAGENLTTAIPAPGALTVYATAQRAESSEKSP